MTSQAKPPVSENRNGDVQCIDIEYDVDNIIDMMIIETDNAKIQVDEIPTDTVTLMNGNDNAINSKPINMAEVIQTVRDAYNRGITRPIQWRRRQLKNLLRMLEENMNEITEAIYEDLKKCKFEFHATEVDIIINDLRNIIYNFDDWCKPERPQKSFVNLLDDVVIYKEPYGVTLIIGAWNYPLLLLLTPACGAIAAGNAIILKPSEMAVACTNFLVENIPKYLDPEAIVLIEGGPQETTELLKQKFDYIFYTGSTNIGKVVYEAATKNLTPVTLELGGKSPAYIDNTADIAITAKRLLWGKLVNAGQTCIAPDYVLCSKEVQEKLVEASKKTIKEWYGENPQKSPDFGRIINNRHFSRLQALIDANKDKIAVGGRYDSTDKYIEPTLITNVTATDKIMNEEIFGPILPIMPIKDAYEAIKFINDREKPLVLYVFSNSDEVQTNFIEKTSSGQIGINETIQIATVKHFPFGGVGGSGMGAYHGKFSFDTFSRKKACLKKDLFFIGDKLSSIRYPPYTEKNYKLLEFALRNRNIPSLKFVYYLLAFVLGALLSYAICIYLE